MYMNKKEYTKPELKCYGDVKKITLGGGTTMTSLDGEWETVNGAKWWGTVPS
jgi:hypothetical protein